MSHHAKDIETVLSETGSSQNGLSSAEAQKRLETEGLNVIRAAKRRHTLLIFLEQFRSLPVMLLAAVALLAFFLGDRVEGGAIVAILLINAIIGFIQERNADNAIAALRKLSALHVKVLRDGVKQLVESPHIVKGDIIFLETGDKIPADARVMEHHSFSVMEAALTGESLPSRKHSSVLDRAAPLAERKNMVFAGTVVASGRASAVVVETGSKTEIGKIAKMIESMDFEETPLQKTVGRTTKYISYAVLVMAVFVFIFLLSRGWRVIDVLLTSAAMVVAALPEGLPVVMTITSAVGIRKMAHKHVLIRRLAAVETLGCVNVICTDKTGTLTKNQMTVTRLFYDGRAVEVTGEGYSPHGDIRGDRTASISMLLQIGVLCNNASYFRDKVYGDPTEIALIVSAVKGGINKEQLEREFKRMDEFEFTSERKMMSTVNLVGAAPMLLMKGAPDEVLKKCDRILRGDRELPLTEQYRREALEANDLFSREGLRVLAFAYRQTFPGETAPAETAMVFVGLQAMMDPPREEVKAALERCRRAGVRVIMITGDHAGTATAVAKHLGLEPRILTGSEIDALASLEDVVEDVIIYARVSPEHKLKIVKALQKRGYVCAMTGDGVNDAPALKKADIGISMGLTGTDVAKEASDMILTDDNFASIVGAIEEGRSIYENIRKFIRYQLSTNVGAILLILLSIALSLPLPLVPVQLLWINISIDGPPALSLGLEPTRPGPLMSRRPRGSNEALISASMVRHILLSGVVMAIGTLAVFWLYSGGDYVLATSIAFTAFSIFQIFNVMNCRSFEESLFRIGPLSNRVALYSIGALFSAHLLILYVPFLQKVFHTTGLSAAEWLLCLLAGSSVFLLYEALKRFSASPGKQPF